MSYSNSLSFFLGLFIILSSQVLAHDMSDTLTPTTDIRSKQQCMTNVRCGINFAGVSGIVAAAANDFNLSDVALESLTNYLIDSAKFEETRRHKKNKKRPQCHASLNCGGPIGWAYNIFFTEPESQTTTFVENTLRQPLNSQVLAHDMFEALTPSTDIRSKQQCMTNVRCGINFAGVVAAAANDFNLSGVALDSLTNYLIDSAKFEETRRHRKNKKRPQCHASLNCGGPIGWAYDIFFTEPESQTTTFVENTLMKNHVETIPGTP